MTVLDASELLAFLQGEDGGALVEEALGAGAVTVAADWSEVAQKVRAHGRDWSLARALLLSFDMQVEPVTIDDAERAATSWQSGEGLSLGDRLCLALGEGSVRRCSPPTRRRVATGAYGRFADQYVVRGWVEVGATGCLRSSAQRPRCISLRSAC